MTQLWKRYFFKEWAKVFLLFFGCFYFLYVLIDLSTHTKAFQKHSVGLHDVVFYYLCQLTQRADVLILFALLVSTLKVLMTLNLRNEIVALVVSGISLKKLLRPFLFAACLCTGVLYLNFQFLYPTAIQKLMRFEEQFFHSNMKNERSSPVHHLFLQDNSLLVYNTYDPIEKVFLDAYWIQSHNDLYRIKKLFPHEKTATGHLVDHIVRSEEGTMERKESMELFSFSQIEFEEKSLYAASHPPRWQSLSQLARDIPWKQTCCGFAKMNDHEAGTTTSFYYKLLLPLTCFLAVIAPAKYALRFGRSLSVFLIFAFSLFGMITFFTLVNSSVILGESQVMPSALALLIPFLACFFFFGWKYAKL